MAGTSKVATLTIQHDGSERVAVERVNEIADLPLLVVNPHSAIFLPDREAVFAVSTVGMY